MKENKIIEISCCAPPRCACPKMLLDDEKQIICIRDDYKGEVFMTFNEFGILSKQFEAYLDDKRTNIN